MMPYTPKILIVDDDPRFCDSLKVLLSNQGYQMQTSNSGREAVEYLVKNNFDLALLDMVMPDINGHQIMDFINSKSPETLVIVITGHASMESAIESLRRGAYDYLRKPFEPEELLKTVENALNNKRLEREKKTIQGKLALTEKRYRYLVDNSPDIVYILDHEGRFTFVNDTIEPLLGFEANQLIGNHYTSIVFEEDIDQARYHFNERRTGKRAAVSTELRLKFYHNGDHLKPSEKKHLAVELKAMGMYDRPADSKDKKFTGTYGVGRDISARKQAQEALRESEENFKALAANANDGILIATGEGVHVYVNKQASEITGYSVPELLKTTIKDLIHPDEFKEISENYQRRLEGKYVPTRYETAIIRKDGKVLPVEVTGAKTVWRGQPADIAIVRDIEDRKLAEEQLKASLKEKEVLLKEIHHRVKNNLQIISSLLDMSRRRSENQEAIDLLSEAGAKIHTMALIHTQLYQSERFDQIDMQSHIRDMIIHLSHLYRAKGNITPVINASGVYLSVTQAIPCALAVNELISNVYRHAFEEGQEGTVDVSMEQSSDGTISLKVKDDGIGIPTEIDINETDTLGLKLVRNLVLGQLKGRLQIERKDGTEILIEFRVVEEGE